MCVVRTVVLWNPAVVEGRAGAACVCTAMEGWKSVSSSRAVVSVEKPFFFVFRWESAAAHWCGAV